MGRQWVTSAQSRLQSIWEVTQILRGPASVARCHAACGNWGRNFSSRSNNSINHCQGSQLKGPSVGFSHVRYVNGIRKVFRQEPSWMYIYLNTHILLVYTNNMYVCDFDKKWVGVCACVHYNYEHDISKAQKLRNETVLRLPADSLYGKITLLHIFLNTADIFCMRIQLSSNPKAKHCYVGL